MTIAVTGATGHLGRLAVEELVRTQGPDDVIAIVRDENKAVDLKELGVEVRVADYSDKSSYEQALRGVDKVLLVSSNEIGKRFDQHRNVIDAAKDAGVGFLVYTSAPKATESALVVNPEHKATEEYLQSSGLNYAIVRNNWYHENYVSQVGIAKETGKLIAAAGNGRVASAARADYAAGAAAVLTSDGHDGRVYEFSGDYAWDFNDLAGYLSEITGRDVVYEQVDGETLLENLKSAGLDDLMAGFVAAIDQNIKDGLLAEVTSDLTKLLDRPTTPFVETMRGC